MWGKGNKSFNKLEPRERRLIGTTDFLEIAGVFNKSG